MGFASEFTQLVFRNGDSATRIISPLMPMFAIIVTFAQKHDKQASMGTPISIMLPYALFLLISWTLLIVLGCFLDIAIGPGAVIHL
jgi:aminobenzoyl-glutamate transport protein